MSEHYLSRLFYASTATEKYTSAELGNILRSCRKNNPALDITGMLFLGNGYFLQCLEGPRSNINSLYKKIMIDERHTQVEVLEFREVVERYFDEWTMKYVGSMKVISKILKETGQKEFNPYSIDNYTLNLMMDAFRNYQVPADSPSTNNPDAAVLPPELSSGVQKKKSSFDILGLFKRS